MSSRHNIAVLAGGMSYEREISLASGQRIAQELRRVGHEVVLHDVDETLVDRLAADRPNAIVVAVHGSGGEDGALRGVLELLGLPFVGASAGASRLAWDKAAAKALWQTAGLSTADWLFLPQTILRELGATQLVQHVVAGLGLPLVVKPTHGGSGLGISVVREASELPHALMTAFSYDESVLIERHIAGMDVAVSVVSDPSDPTHLMALPVVEIEPMHGAYDYQARYMAGSSTWHVPARLDEKIAAVVAERAVEAHRILQLGSLSRVDAIVQTDGQVVLLEANTSPGMTETSLLPLAAQAAGIPLGKLFDSLIDHAISAAHRLPGQIS